MMDKYTPLQGAKLKILKYLGIDTTGLVSAMIKLPLEGPVVISCDYLTMDEEGRVLIEDEDVVRRTEQVEVTFDRKEDRISAHAAEGIVPPHTHSSDDLPAHNHSYTRKGSSRKGVC